MPRQQKPSKIRSLKFDIRTVLEHYGCYVPPGRTVKVKVKCFHHDDKVASASVDLAPGKQRFHCFACGLSGDALDIIREVEGLGLEAAIVFAQSITGESSETVPPESAPSPSLFDW